MAYNTLYNSLGFWSYFVMAIIILVAFFIHEFSKVVIANFISENAVTKGVPLKTFIEPIGFILMFCFGIGWSNSATINPVFFKNRKKDTLKVYLGAVFANIILGIFFIIMALTIESDLIAMSGLGITNQTALIFAQAIYTLGQVILAVGIMNLIPMHPFSGYKIFYELASPNAKMALVNNRTIIQLIVVLLIFYGVVGNIVGTIVSMISSIF